MNILIAFVTSFLSALGAVLVAMLAFTLLDPQALKPLVALGIASGTGLASAIRARKEVSANTFALMVGALVGLGSILGTWFSNR